MQTPSFPQKAASNPEEFSRMAERPAPHFSFYLRHASSCTSIIITPRHPCGPLPLNADHLPLTTANLLAATGGLTYSHERRRRPSSQVIWRRLRTGSIRTLRFLGRAIVAPVAIPTNAFTRKRRGRPSSIAAGLAGRKEEERQRQWPYFVTRREGWQLESVRSPVESGTGGRSGRWTGS